MDDRHLGLDVNGLVDRAGQLDWASGRAELMTSIGRAVVIAPVDDRQPVLAGQAALLHPAGRGWQRPAWTNRDARRRPVADLLATIAAGGDGDASHLLGAHLHHMAGRIERIGLAVPDDFSTAAQARVIDAVRSAGRYHPRDGWRPLTALLLWRSVAAIFGWVARTLSAQEAAGLKGCDVRVVSLLADRLLVSSMSLDVDVESNAGRPLVTPVRSKAGNGYGASYAPIDLETDLVEGIDNANLTNQLSLIGAGRDYCLGRVPDCLLQDLGGRWIPVPPPPPLSPERRLEAVTDLYALLEEAGLEGARNSIILVETPDPTRGFKDRSWQQLAALRIRKLLNLADSDTRVVALEPESVALGCAEYAARLANELPTFFDYLPQIEICAFDADDEYFSFIPLLKAERVAGNQPFRQTLPGRFQVDAGNNSITFYLTKADERFVGKSVVQLPLAPERAVPIRLDVEQRPVNGYAVIDIVPSEPGALGPTRISLDWRRMEDTGKVARQILDELGATRPRAYPNCAPTDTHASVWEALDVASVVERFLDAPPSVLSAAYRESLRELRSVFGRRVNPQRVRGIGVDENLRPFTSNGEPPAGGLGSSLFGARELTTRIRAKIDKDLGGLHSLRTSQEAKRLRGDLLIAGSWMFAGAPDSVVSFFRRVATGKEPVGRRMEAMSRVLCNPDDIEAAFRFIQHSLSRRRNSNPPWARSMRDLKSVALLLEYHETASRILNTPQAELVLECALGTLQLEFSAGNAPLQQKFLWAVKSILLILRHRKANPNFLSPPENGSVGATLYERTLLMLRGAQGQARRRRASQIARDAVENAILFLQKTGGNPDIIRAISQSEDNVDDDGEAEDDAG